MVIAVSAWKMISSVYKMLLRYLGLRFLSGKGYCWEGLFHLSGKGYCGICLEKVIAVSVWKRLLRYLSGKGYCGICLEKGIAVSA